MCLQTLPNFDVFVHGGRGRGFDVFMIEYYRK
jgi:hypothetical protein